MLLQVQLPEQQTATQNLAGWPDSAEAELGNLESHAGSCHISISRNMQGLTRMHSMSQLTNTDANLGH